MANPQTPVLKVVQSTRFRQQFPPGVIAEQSPHQIEPTWEIVSLFPMQGEWSEAEYLALDTNRLVEFSNGTVEVLELPSQTHQLIVMMLYRLLERFNETKSLGVTLLAPFSVKLWEGKFREPDIMFMLNKNEARRSEQFWVGADLVMEVVSPESRQRDSVTKRGEYARGRIPEYWLIDPQGQTITVLYLHGRSYRVHGEFKRGEQATSRLLAGFNVDVASVF